MKLVYYGNFARSKLHRREPQTKQYMDQPTHAEYM